MAETRSDIFANVLELQEYTRTFLRYSCYFIIIRYHV